MDHPVIHFTTVFMALFAIMNPIANAPVFIGVTQSEDATTLRSVAMRATLAAFIIVAMFTLLGQNAIKVVSRLMGLILAVIGVQMQIDGIRGAIAAG